jgi:hypothetical protein
MALGNFIKTLWQANIEQALRNAHVYAAAGNQNYQGQLKSLGDKVKVMQLSDITIAAYTKATTVSPAEVDDAAMELTADQPYYFAFKVSDLEAVQEKPVILRESTDQAAYGFRDKVDTYFAGLYAQSGMTSYSTGTTPWDVTSLNVEDVLLAAGEKMDDNKVPREGRFLIIPPWFHTKLVLASLTTKTQNDAVAANGFVDRVLGFSMHMSNNVSAANTTTWDQTRIMGGVQGQSWSFADAILSIEAYRLEAGFHDAVKGLYVFGGKIMRPDKTITIYADKTAEA